MDVPTEEDLEITDADFDMEDIEGEMDFPEEWMVLDDADEEHMEEDQHCLKPNVAAGDAEVDRKGSETTEKKATATPASSSQPVQTDIKATPSAKQPTATAKKPQPAGKKPSTSAPTKQSSGKNPAQTRLASHPPQTSDASKKAGTAPASRAATQSKSPAQGTAQVQPKSSAPKTLGQSKPAAGSVIKSKSGVSGLSPSQTISKLSPGQTKIAKSATPGDPAKSSAPSVVKTADSNKPASQPQSSGGPTRAPAVKTAQIVSKPASETKPGNQTAVKTAQNVSKPASETKPGNQTANKTAQNISKPASETKPGNQTANKTAQNISKPASETKPGNQTPSNQAETKSPTDQKTGGQTKATSDTKSTGSDSQQKQIANQTKSSANGKGNVPEKVKGSSGQGSDRSGPELKVNTRIGENMDKSARKETVTKQSEDSPKRSADRPDTSGSSRSNSKPSSSSDDKSNNRAERASDRPRTGSSTDVRSSSQSGKQGAKPREALRSRSDDRRRSRSLSRERSRDRNSYYGRSTDKNSSKVVDRKPAETKKSDTSGLSGKKESSSGAAGKSGTATITSNKAESAHGKKEQGNEIAVHIEDKETQRKVTQSGTQKAEDLIKASEQLFNMKSNAIEQGLWRFSLRLSPLELADFAKQEFRNLLNTAQDCIVFLKNQGQNKKKKGESHMYFNRLLTTKCTMQKLLQLQLTSKKLEVEINRKVLNSKDKDSVTLEVDLTTPGSLSVNPATSMLMTKSADEDKNIHISNVPKNTTQELLFVVFPTAFSIQMPKEGKDRGNVVVQFRSAQCADDVMKCYTSVSINKTKLKLSRKASSASRNDESKGFLKNSTERVKKPLASPRKRKGSREDSPSRDTSKDSEPPAKVYQIPVLNKRVSSGSAGAKGRGAVDQPDAKRQRMDQLPPPPVPQAYGGYTAPSAVPPHMAVATGFMQPAVHGGFQAVPNSSSFVSQPMWPVSSGVPVMSHQMQVTGPQDTRNWQTPQQSRFGLDDKVQGAEAISPEWDEDKPRLAARDSSRNRQTNQRSGTERDDFGPRRRSLSPVRVRRYGSRSPTRPVRRRVSKSPMRTRHRSVSPIHNAPNQRRGRSPLKRERVDRLGRSPPRSSGQTYRSLSPDRVKRSPRRFAGNTRRPDHQDRSRLSPVRQGRHSRSPENRLSNAGRKGNSPYRQSQLRKRRSTSPHPVGQRSYSPISQGALSRSPGRRGPSPVRQGHRDYTHKRSHSPARRGASPKHDGGMDRPRSRPEQKTRSPGRENERDGHGLILARQAQYQGRQSGSPGPQSRTGNLSQAAARGTYSSGRQSPSPVRTSHRMGYSPISDRLSRNPEQPSMVPHRPSARDHAQCSLSPHRPMESLKSHDMERTEEGRTDRGGWTGFTSLPASSASVASRIALFPSAFPSKTTTAEFHEPAKMDIPGLDLLLAATAEKIEMKTDRGPSGMKVWDTPGDSQREATLRQEALQTLGRRDMYQPKDLKPASFDDRGNLQGRDLQGGNQDRPSGWWREDGPKPSPSLFGRETGAYDAARERQGDVRLKENVDLRNIREQTSQHLGNIDFTPNIPRSQGFELGRAPNAGRSMESQEFGRGRDIGGGTDSQQSNRMQEGAPRDPDLHMTHRMAQGMPDAGDIKLPLKSALRKPTPATEWPTGPASGNQLGLNHPEMNRSGGMNPLGTDRPGFDRPGMDRPNLDCQGFDRQEYDRPGLDRSQWPNQPGRPAEAWGNSRVQDWNHGSAGSEQSHNADVARSQGQNRSVEGGYRGAGGGRNMPPGLPTAWVPDAGPAPSVGLGCGGRGGEQDNWLGPQGVGMQRAVGNAPYRDSGSWLPPPRPLDQNVPGHQHFGPRPPF